MDAPWIDPLSFPHDVATGQRVERTVGSNRRDGRIRYTQHLKGGKMGLDRQPELSTPRVLGAGTVVVSGSIPVGRNHSDGDIDTATATEDT